MTSTHTSSTGTTRPVHPAVILGIVLVSYFMIVLDNSIVFTGLSRIRTELDFTTAGLAWVQTAYALVFGGLLLLAARAGDLVGRRRTATTGPPSHCPCCSSAPGKASDSPLSPPPA